MSVETNQPQSGDETMIAFQSDVPPRIDASEWVEVSECMEVWDYLTFNSDGDIVYRIEETLPVVGKITVSFWARERHVRIYTESQGASGDDVIYSDYPKLGTLANRERIIKFAKRQLVKRLATELE